jgi:DNA-binding Lrp family transcriptional regulator
MKLDKKDKELLHLCYIDSRMSFTRMGKKLRLSGSAVERRMQKLQRAGIINMMFAAVNLSKLGLKAYRLYFKFDVMDKFKEQEVIKIFQEYPKTVWGVVCQGEYDALWRIVARDEKEVEDVAYIMIEKFGKSIIEKTIITTTYQTLLSWNNAFDCNREPEVPIERITNIESVNETDMRILAALNDNSRKTTVALAQLTGLSPDAVRYRIKRLIKENYILGFTAWFDARKLGFEYYKILITFRSITRAKEKQFLSYCLENDMVVFLNKCIGAWDIEVDIIVRNINELHEFITDLKTRFSDIIGKHTFITAIHDSLYNPLRGEV